MYINRRTSDESVPWMSIMSTMAGQKAIIFLSSQSSDLAQTDWSRGLDTLTTTDLFLNFIPPLLRSQGKASQRYSSDVKMSQ